MQIEKIHIKGFRNFEDAEIVLQNKTLIIGANDVGKTNLLYALRLLFDKTLSEHDLELSDGDYNAYSKSDSIEITVTLCDVKEECLLSEFQGSVKDGRVIIRYINSKSDDYKILIGFSEDTLAEISYRKYIKRLNMQYVNTNRDLFAFLRHERNKILQISKNKLSEEDIRYDDDKIKQIQSNLDHINDDIDSLKYISSSLSEVNIQLNELSAHNEDQTVRFIAGESKADKLLDNLVLASSTAEDSPLSIGGDGRNNQIFFATWIAKQHIKECDDHVTFYAIEEPEAHLHPHQQRKLSSYIQNSFNSQVLITTHSSHIAAKFNPNNIVRLYTCNKTSLAACEGCSEIIKKEFDKFSYRLNPLSAEIFFSDGVFLVEGVSEVLFYSALADVLKLNLDRYNITILPVEGIGFKPYVAVCNALNIPWVLRTDNDVFTKPKKNPTKKYYSGLTRVISIIETLNIKNNSILDYWGNHSNQIEWPVDNDAPNEAVEVRDYIKNEAEKLNIFLSIVDLETDLANSEISSDLLSYYEEQTKDGLVKKMKNRKAENMYNFINENSKCLDKLKNDNILTPLNKIINIVESKKSLNDDTKKTD